MLYHRYKLDVWHLAWFTLRDHHDAEDAVQETFLKAHRALDQYRRDGTLRPWLLTICRNACRDRLRARPAPRASRSTTSGAAGGRRARRDPERASTSAGRWRRCPRRIARRSCSSTCWAATATRRRGSSACAAASTLRSRLARARRALAPAVPNPPSPQRAAPTCGALLHSRSRALCVVCDGAGEAPGAHAADLARPGAAAAAGSPARRARQDLVAFLERLDRRIPDGALVRASSTTGPRPRRAVAGRAPALAHAARAHDRVVGRRGRRLLARALPRRRRVERDRLRALLSDGDPSSGPATHERRRATPLLGGRAGRRARRRAMADHLAGCETCRCARRRSARRGGRARARASRAARRPRLDARVLLAVAADRTHRVAGRTLPPGRELPVPRRLRTLVAAGAAVAAVALALVLAVRPALVRDDARAVPIVPLTADCGAGDRRGDAAHGGRLVVAGVWAGAEARRFAQVLQRFEDRTGVKSPTPTRRATSPRR